jgi:glucokinase
MLSGDKIGPIDHVAVSGHPSAIAAIGGFMNDRGDRGRIGAAILGVAGPVERGRCLITNSNWVADAAELHAVFGFKSVSLINDFEAIAWALPQLSTHDVRPIGTGRALPAEPMVVVGPGTGLGMAALVCRGSNITVIATEGGHATLPGTTLREDAVIAHLRRRFGHASAERALSGPGLENLYEAIAAIDNAVVPSRSATEITRTALDRGCATCRAAVDMFCSMLGTVAGNLALTFRARGGVYIAGGIAPRLADDLGQSEFRARFEAKGRFRKYVESIPTTVIMNPDAAFLGLKSLAGATTVP